MDNHRTLFFLCVVIIITSNCYPYGGYDKGEPDVSYRVITEIPDGSFTLDLSISPYNYCELWYRFGVKDSEQVDYSESCFYDKKKDSLFVYQKDDVMLLSGRFLDQNYSQLEVSWKDQLGDKWLSIPYHSYVNNKQILEVYNGTPDFDTNPLWSVTSNKGKHVFY